MRTHLHLSGLFELPKIIGQDLAHVGRPRPLPCHAKYFSGRRDIFTDNGPGRSLYFVQRVRLCLRDSQTALHVNLIALYRTHIFAESSKRRHDKDYESGE